MTAVRIGVVGAGPAGLTAAITARRLGLEVVVYEQAPAVGRVGGGIAIQSNGQRVLDALGLLRGFERFMEPAGTILVEGPGRRRYARLDYGALPVPFPRFAVVLRADLQLHLVESARREGVQLELGRRCTGITRHGATTGVRFADGDAAECTVVLAADGAGSAVRTSAGLAGDPRPVGHAALRGVVDRPATPGVAREIWTDDGRLFGIAPLPARRTYFYCSAPLGGWQDVLHDARRWLDGWRDALPEGAALLETVPDWRQVTYDELREVHAPRWTEPGCILLGDAAHAMTPNLGQGANSAMVDALVLVRLLRETLDAGGTTDDAGRRYEALRRPFVRRIQSAAHVMMRLASVRGPSARLARRGLMALAAGAQRFSRSGLLLGAGVNPAEEPWLRPLGESRRAARDAAG